MRWMGRAAIVSGFALVSLVGRRADAHDVDRDWAHERPETNVQAAAEPANATPDAEPGPDPNEKRRPFVLSFNPAAIIIGRVSFTGELSWAPHHALVASAAAVPFVSYDPPSPAAASCAALPCGGSSAQPVQAQGGLFELGYRAYTGRTGPTGAFIGGSLIGGALNGRPGGAYALYGAALDGGAQLMTSRGLVLGLGFGIAAQHVTREFPASDLRVGSLTQSTVYPRFLFSIGVAP